MTERVLGPKESPRRRWTVLLTLIAVFAFGLMYVAGAQAVHDDGVFALEGNATTGNECTTDANDTPSGCDPHNPLGQTDGEDWDKIYDNTDSADETSGIVADTTLSGGLAGQGDSILSENTKDIQPISGPGSWTWKQTTTTSAQDKADIEHAYAAQYGDHLYYGADRFSNSGDTVMGFWFFRGEVGTNPVDAGGNGTFTGSHTARETGCTPISTCDRGDILIVADFRQGGKAPQIQVYEWVVSGGSAATNLDLIGGGPNPASCTQAPGEKPNDDPVAPVADGDPLCATANQFVIESPWPFEAKANSGGTSGDGGSDTKFGVAEFMEGGIDLGFFGFGDTCFSSFMAETRASHSVTSTLSDFVLGGFGSCESGIVTTPQSGAGGAVPTSIGTTARVEVRDHAEITVSGTSGAFDGTVKFYLCGPFAAAYAENCSTGGVQIGSPVAGETVSGSGGSAAVNSDTATLTSAGRYCWRAEYSGDADVGIPPSSDPEDSVADGGTTSECFTIAPVTPTLATTASADVTLGSPIYDTISLTGTAKQPGDDGIGPGNTINASAASQDPAGGTISFTAYGPDDCTTVAHSGTIAVNGDNTAYGGSGSATEFTPTAIGKYTFVASYDGNSPNTLGAGPSSCPPGPNDGDEEVTVTGSASLATAQRWLPNDTAHITSQAGTTLAGDVTFSLYPNLTCTGSSVFSQTKDVVTDANSGGTANNRFVSTTNTDYFVTVTNDGNAWSWLVSYDDDALADPDDECETTSSFTLDDD